jgi:hypothetical protein
MQGNALFLPSGRSELPPDCNYHSAGSAAKGEAVEAPVTMHAPSSAAPWCLNRFLATSQRTQRAMVARHGHRWTGLQSRAHRWLEQRTTSLLVQHDRRILLVDGDVCNGCREIDGCTSEVSDSRDQSFIFASLTFCFRVWQGMHAVTARLLREVIAESSVSHVYLIYAFDLVHERRRHAGL